MSNELAVVPNRELTPQTWGMIMQMAPVMFESRMFGVSSSAAAAAIILKGYELGLSVTASFEFIQVIQGKPGLSPRGALALLHSNPEITKLEIKRLADDKGKFVGYECTMARKNGFTHTSRYTMADAQTAGLVKAGSGWANYPENMAMWRAIGFAADVVAPDITAGMTAVMKMPEQMGVALDDKGNVIDGTFAPVQAQTPTTAPVEAPVTIWTLDQLVDLFGADKVLIANDGKLPETQADIDNLALKLAEGAN